MKLEHALEKVRENHNYSISWGRWFCQCGAEGRIPAVNRTDRQAEASAQRHLKGALRRYIETS